MSGMPMIAEVWKTALPEIRENVSGRAAWSALNAATAVAYEDGVLVLGLPHKDNELASHLGLPASRKAIEDAVGKELNEPVRLRIIAGVGPEDWVAAKQSDQVKRRMQEQALERARAELAGRSSWEGLYEQLSRKFAEMTNRSLPQSKARFFIEAVDIVSNALRETPVDDDMAERNFARCIERIAQYSEVPSTLVATRVLEKAFER